MHFSSFVNAPSTHCCRLPPLRLRLLRYGHIATAVNEEESEVRGPTQTAGGSLRHGHLAPGTCAVRTPRATPWP